MPEWVVGKVEHALAERDGGIKGSRILVLGLAYKKNVDDVRETPAAEILELLIERGARVEYSDPYVPRFPRMRAHYLDLESVPLEAKTLELYDCIVLVTDHDAFDYALIRRHARLLVDTRGRYTDSGLNIVHA